jgi:hypothetical protein
MNQVKAARSHQRPEAADPAHSPSSPEAVNSKAGLLQLADQGVFVPQEIGHFVIEPGSVEIGGGAHQELLGPSSSQSLDQQHDAFQEATISS